MVSLWTFAKGSKDSRYLAGEAETGEVRCLFLFWPPAELETEPAFKKQTTPLNDTVLRPLIPLLLSTPVLAEKIAALSALAVLLALCCNTREEPKKQTRTGVQKKKKKNQPNPGQGLGGKFVTQGSLSGSRL